jgi:anaerobic selenocysteine-containing dehydrogenase
MCYNVCSIRVHRVNGVAVKIEGIPEAPPNYGKLCAKGNAGLMNLYNAHRVTSPLLRTNPQKGIGVDPEWKQISWEEAMNLFVEKLRAARLKDPAAWLRPPSIAAPIFIARLHGRFGSPNVTNTAAGFSAATACIPSLHNHRLQRCSPRSRCATT